MYINNSNTATKVILMATLTASSATQEYELDFDTGIDYNPTQNYVHSDLTPFRSWNEDNSFSSDNTVYWNSLSSLDNSLSERFQRSFFNSDLLEVSKGLFSKSELLSGKLEEILIDTVLKVGKMKTSLPNRL